MSRKRVRSSEYESDSSDSDSERNVLIPDPDYSGSDDSGSDFDSDCEHEIPNITYNKARANYSEKQDKLEKGHEFTWIEGEKLHPDSCEDKVLLSESQKKKIRRSEPFQLFETFFSIEMKKYIIDACKDNGYDLKLKDLDTFIGIVIFSTFNPRKSQRDYWSSDPYLSNEVVSSAMSRQQFEIIKSKLKYSKNKDKDSNDRGWRVRSLLKLFQNNIMKFGIWRTALSVDEMMAKSYAKTVLKQFIRGKPIRFGLKFWGLCTSDGYLLNLDLYCGKNSQIGDKLSKCALGSRVVLYLLQPFFQIISYNKISQFHLYFDNFFTNMDLVLHLKKLRLKCTGTIRDNRVKEKNVLDKKAPRGTYVVKHDVNSGINFITIMDSKPVSIASTAAGVNPLSISKRYSAEAKSKIEIPFPQAFHLYNKFMGGVDLHDGHCNDILPSIRSKKWTWVVFMRLIQASITNSLVIFNAANDGKKKVGIKEFTISIAKYYLQKSSRKSKAHERSNSDKLRICSNGNCPIRTKIFCKTCNLNICNKCWLKKHN
jgi:hypothetical protein